MSLIFLEKDWVEGASVTRWLATLYFTANKAMF